MAGLVPLRNAPYVSNSASALVKERANTSPSSTQQHGFRNRIRQVPFQQLHHNEVFGVPIETKCYKMEDSKAKKRLTVRSKVAETIPMIEKLGEYTKVAVGSRWRKIQGENDWKGLVGDPQFDPVLRAELLRYGDFCQASYDSFDKDPRSPYCGSCKYSHSRLFEKMGLEDCGYEVTDYIWATAGENLPLVKWGVQYFKFMNLVDEQGNKVPKGEPWSLATNWTGFVAVAKDSEVKRLGRRDIVVVWRGTVLPIEWAEDMLYFSKPAGLDPRGSKEVTGKSVNLMVEAGFLELYKANNPKYVYTVKSARQQVLGAIKRLVKKYGDEELSITVCGHSLGSALAMLTGYDIAETGVNQISKLPDHIATWDNPGEAKVQNRDQVVEWTRSKDVKTVPVTVYSFAGPRVGNDVFRDRINELQVKVLRVVNVHDMVPDVPGLIVNEKVRYWLTFAEKYYRKFYNWLDSLPGTYSHVGVELLIDTSISPYLKKNNDAGLAHNLEAYLHVLSGFHGPGKEFEQAISRDYALVNKVCDFLDEKHYVPPKWWQEENKGLVRSKDGNWVRRPRDEADIPRYDLADRDT